MEAKEQEATAVTANGTTPDAGAEIERLQRLLEEQRQAAETYLRNWQRAQADLSNYKRRAEQERNERVRWANEEFARALLPILDDLERAFTALPAELRGFTWIHGVYLIDRKLRAALEAHGVREIEAVDQPFDPLLHEAVMREEVEPERDGRVVGVFQRGYRYHERVLRPALVKVGASRQGAGAQEPATGAGSQAAEAERSGAGGSSQG